MFLYPNSALRVLPAVYLGTGFVVWLIGRESVHFGASGLVYGLASHVFVAGLLRRDRRAIARLQRELRVADPVLVPHLDQDVQDLAALARFAGYLLS